jgi:hypothetical protein
MDRITTIIKWCFNQYDLDPVTANQLPFLVRGHPCVSNRLYIVGVERKREKKEREKNNEFSGLFV